MTFKQVEAQPNFIQKEKDLLTWWYEEGVVEEYLHKNDEATERFAFLDGPITANNPMGVHHAHGRTIKDFFQRYKNMCGFKQRFQNGFDCQGLWVEVEEEKERGFNSKRDIEEFGLENFSIACRQRVERFSGVQTEQSKRLGMFMDWDNSYYTMSEENNVHIWYFLKKIHEKGWLYHGVDAMPWCTRCGTAISQHELSDGGYKDVTHESIYVSFPLLPETQKYLHQELQLPKEQTIHLLVWTTTPWTLLANVAVAVNPEVTYSVVDTEGRYLVVAQERLSVLTGAYQELGALSGQQLLDHFDHLDRGIYQGPFDLLEAASRVEHRVIPWHSVSAEDGTGLVHIAPGAGKEDFELHKEFNLDLLTPIDDFGDYVEGYGAYTSQNVFDVRGQIYQSLKEQDLFYKTESIFHAYPHCWRCKHELVFKTTKEWFIKSDEIRPLMKEAAKEAKWMPDHVLKRMQDWLDNMGDWPISRRRYWGLALPFYENEDKSKFVVIGSRDELREKALHREKVDDLPELHRPWIDEIKLDGTKVYIDGEQQDGVWTRVTDVGDCWLDAGIVPFSTVHYLTDKDYWEKWYPFDFITEYVAQVKLWFYATLFMSVALEGRVPWKHVLATGFLVDEKGKAMHKSLGNAISLDEAAEKAGADPIRWLYLRERSANYHGIGNLRFGYTILDEVRRRFLAILWNTYRYFITHAQAEEWESSSETPTPHHELDRWIVARWDQVLAEVTQALDEFNTPDAAALLEVFVVQDVSQWYVRRSRDRLSPANEDKTDKDSFFSVMYYLLKNVSTVLAPFVPFIAEEMYQNLRQDNDPRSVHLADWPEATGLVTDESLLADMKLLREVVEKGHSLRKQAGVRLRQPLPGVIVQNVPHQLNKELEEIMKDELNVKTVMYQPEGDEFSVSLDFELTPELIREGVSREITREIQNLRRQAGYDFTDKVQVYWESTAEEMHTAVVTFGNLIGQHTVCRLQEGRIDDVDVASELETGLGKIWLGVKKDNS